MREPRLKVFVKPFRVGGEQSFCRGLYSEVERKKLSTRLKVDEVEVETARVMPACNRRNRIQ